MLPFGYDSKQYNGKIWWNDENPTMRFIWGTQEDYDNHIKNGGTWQEYINMVNKRIISFQNNSVQTEEIEKDKLKH